MTQKHTTSGVKSLGRVSAFVLAFLFLMAAVPPQLEAEHVACRFMRAQVSRSSDGTFCFVAAYRCASGVEIFFGDGCGM